MEKTLRRTRVLLGVLILLLSYPGISSTSEPQGITALKDSPNIDGIITDGEWSLNEITLPRYSLNNTYTPPFPVFNESSLTAELGLSYNNTGFFLALLIPNMTIMGTGFTLGGRISLDDSIQKDWSPSAYRYARGDTHSFQFFSETSSWKYDNFFVGNSTDGWRFTSGNEVSINGLNESIQYSVSGNELQFGRVSIEMNFQFWENSGRVRDLSRTSPYRLCIHLAGHYYWDSQSYDWSFRWPTGAIHPLFNDPYTSEIFFTSWMLIDCPNLITSPTPQPLNPYLLLVAFGVIIFLIVIIILIRRRF